MLTLQEREALAWAVWELASEAIERVDRRPRPSDPIAAKHRAAWDRSLAILRGVLVRRASWDLITPGEFDDPWAHAIEHVATLVKVLDEARELAEVKLSSRRAGLSLMDQAMISMMPAPALARAVRKAANARLVLLPPQARRKYTEALRRLRDIGGFAEETRRPELIEEIRALSTELGNREEQLLECALEVMNDRRDEQERLERETSHRRDALRYALDVRARSGGDLAPQTTLASCAPRAVMNARGSVLLWTGAALGTTSGPDPSTTK